MKGGYKTHPYDNNRAQMMNKTHDDFDGFAVNIFLDEDGDYLAHFVELPNVSAFAPPPGEALVELEEAWALMKEMLPRRWCPCSKSTIAGGI